MGQKGGSIEKSMNNNLRTLLSSLFTIPELRRLLTELDETRRQPGAESIEDSIPWQVDKSQVAFEVERAIQNRGYADQHFFRRIIMLRPDRFEEIMACAQRMQVDVMLRASPSSSMLRVEYRPMSRGQYFLSMIEYGLFSRWAVPMYMVTVVAIIVFLVFSSFLAISGSLSILFLLTACFLVSLGAYCLAAWYATVKLYPRHGALPTIREVLICTREGLEIRSPTRASLTPLQLVRVVRCWRGWMVELGSTSFEYFYDSNRIEECSKKYAEFWLQMEKLTKTK